MRRLFFLSTQDVSSKLGWIWKLVSRARRSWVVVPSDDVLATPGDQLCRYGKLLLTSFGVLGISWDGTFGALLF